MLTAYMDVLLTLTSFDSLSELVFTGLVDVVCQVLEVYQWFNSRIIKTLL